MEKIQAHITGQIISSNSQEAYSLNKKSNFGEKVEDKIQYSVSETLYLVEKQKMDLLSGNKKIAKKEILNKLRKIDKKIQLKYPVYKDMRDKGYLLKTALKFGADFRVYDKGAKPGKKHAKWILFIEHESKRLALHEFAAKNRVAHSTKKNLLFAIIDEENKITYYEIKWIKP